jgi:uncharacterized protein (TIGR02679 family)
MSDEMNTDLVRLRQLLGAVEADWLRERLRVHVERTGTLPVTVSLRGPTPAQREFIDRLFGRRPSKPSSNLSVKTEQLERLLRDAQLCSGVVAALRLLDGPLRDRKAEAETLERGWQATHAFAREQTAGRAWMEAWVEDLISSGVWKRKANGDPQLGLKLIQDALRVVARFPFSGVCLPELAAGIYGDAHALDRHGSLGLFAVRAAANLGGFDDWQSADGWRECWAAAGVICDELSAPVLTLNLGSHGHGLTDHVLAMHAELGEACSLSLRQLVRHGPTFEHLAGQDVFVCENPTVVAVAVERLGAHCAPLVCTSGHPRGAARLLFRELTKAGAHLRVRADFDIDGLCIAAQILALPGSLPWRMSTSDYLATQGGPPLRREYVPQIEWDAQLSSAISQRGVGVHEETMLEALLGDLDTRRDSSIKV